MIKTIIETVLTAFSVVLFYAAVDFFISLKPIVHKYVKSKTLINVYDLLSNQAPSLVKAVALDKSIPITETRDAAINKLSSLVSRNGFNVTPETIKRYVNSATDAYKASDGKFVQSTEQLSQQAMDNVFNSLVAANPEANASDQSVHSVATSQAPAPSASIGSDSNGK